MQRIVSVWLPQWPIERLQRERGRHWNVPAEAPFALVEAGERGLTLSAVNTAALAQGLLPGLGFADARARCPHLRSAAADATADARGLLDLARWCGRYSPTLNVDGADGLWLDATGVAHLFGGEAAFLDDIVERLGRLGVTARAASADTLGAAWALARYGSPVTAAEGGCHLSPAERERPRATRKASAGNTRGSERSLHRALAPLPVEALRLAPATSLLLRRLGLKRIGQLYDLPRASLARRFGNRDAAEAVLTRLDQALGRREEPLTPLKPPPLYAARAIFPEPLISTDAFEAALARLAEALCAQLARDLVGARALAFTAYRADGTHARLSVGLSAPCREPAHMLRLLQEKGQDLDLGFGVDALLLAASAVERRGPAQTAFAAAPTTERTDRLIDRLAIRLGPARVLSPLLQASHVPERAQSWRSALAGHDGRQPPRLRAAAFPAAATTQSGLAPSLPPGPPRPPLLLDRPEPIAVLAEVPEGPPARFTWRRVTRRVVRAEGPERIAPEWWRTLSNERGRDYYRIEDEAGGRYWVFREGIYDGGEARGPAWYLHGLLG